MTVIWLLPIIPLLGWRQFRTAAPVYLVCLVLMALVFPWYYLALSGVLGASLLNARSWSLSLRGEPPGPVAVLRNARGNHPARAPGRRSDQ